MRRLFGLVLLAAAGLLLAACAAGSAGPKSAPAAAVGAYTGGPRLAFDLGSVDYGKVQFNQQVKAAFTARNVGDRPLSIRKVDVKTVQGC